MLCHLTGQIDPDCFETFCLATRTTHHAILPPCRLIVLISLPAIALYMCCIHDVSAVLLVRKTDIDTLQPLCLTTCTTHLTIVLPCLPAVALHMGTVGHVCLCFTCNLRIRIGCILCIYNRRRTRLRIIAKRICGIDISHSRIEGSTFLYNHNLDSLQTFCITGCS